jgi:hypothetical protein
VSRTRGRTAFVSAARPSSHANHSTDQNARAIPPARSDTNPRASRTPDNESARQNHTQNHASPLESHQASLPALATRRPIVEIYAKTLQTAPAAPRRASAPPRYPAIPPAAPPPPAPETSGPAAAQTGTLARCDRAAKRTSPRDGTVRNVHRKKDIPRQPRSTPPEKHSTSAPRARARQPPAPLHTAPHAPHISMRRANRSCGNAAPFALASVSENL